jgi:hypothetical protein
MAFLFFSFFFFFLFFFFCSIARHDVDFSRISLLRSLVLAWGLRFSILSPLIFQSPLIHLFCYSAYDMADLA